MHWLSSFSPLIFSYTHSSQAFQLLYHLASRTPLLVSSLLLHWRAFFADFFFLLNLLMLGSSWVPSYKFFLSLCIPTFLVISFSHRTLNTLNTVYMLITPTCLSPAQISPKNQVCILPNIYIWICGKSLTFKMNKSQLPIFAPKPALPLYVNFYVAFVCHFGLFMWTLMYLFISL